MDEGGGSGMAKGTSGAAELDAAELDAAAAGADAVAAGVRAGSFAGEQAVENDAIMMERIWILRMAAPFIHHA